MMDLRETIKIVNILNVDETQSTVLFPKQVVFKEEINNTHYIVSDADEELLILVEFQQLIDLHLIKIYCLPSVSNEEEEEDDISGPKQIHIYKLKNLSINFEDIKEMKPDKSIICSLKKLENGQKINLKKKSKDSFKFKSIKYLAIYVASNQNDTENTYINNITFNGGIDGKHSSINNKMDGYYEFDRTDNENKKQLKELISSFNHQNNRDDMNLIDLLKPSDIYSNNNIDQCSVSSCSYFERISIILKKYTDTDTDNIYQNHKYNDTNLLNDFHHLLFYHSSEFEAIHDSLIEKSDGNICDLSKCQILKRNQRDRSRFSGNYDLLKTLYLHSDDNDDGDDDDEYNIIRLQLIDRIHCHYFHSFDIGYKIKRDTLKTISYINSDDEDQQEMKENNNSFDKSVDKINKWIISKRNEYKNVDGLQRLTNKNNKFVFEPETIENDDEKTEVLQEYSFGKRYFYWVYYKDNDELTDDAHWMGSHTNMRQIKAANSGFRVKDWYIPEKYTDFKDELLNNEICIIGSEQWNNLMKKAIRFIDTDYVREITICPRVYTAKCYDMVSYESALMTKDHLIAIMVYCNYDVLQFNFTATFRKKHNSESDEELKNRHRNYHFLGKLLRECVECFGVKMKEKKENLSLWHGLNKRFAFSSIYAIIKGPLSTSTDYAVSSRFCNNKGTILNININTSQFSQEYHIMNDNVMLRKSMFDCHWISAYPNEQEIFFIGGLNVFHFDDIIVAPKGQKYAKYIRGLKQMTIMMSTGAGLNFDIRPPSTSEEKQMVFRLFSNELYRYYPNDINAHQFKSCPIYFRNILHEHCKRIEYIAFHTKQQHRCKINEFFFKYDNGWIKIDALNALFPSMKTLVVHAQDEDISFFKQSSIYNVVLSFLKNRKNASLDHIHMRMNINYLSEISKYLQFYQHEFQKYSWEIRVNTIDANRGLGTPRKFDASIVMYAK